MKKNIMFHIYAIYLLRKIWTPFVTEAILFITLLITLFLFVSVPSVLSNMFNSGDLYHYFINAFSSTDLMVQATLVLTGATTILFLKNIAFNKTIRERMSSVLSFIYAPFLVK